LTAPTYRSFFWATVETLAAVGGIRVKDGRVDADPSAAHSRNRWALSGSVTAAAMAGVALEIHALTVAARLRKRAQIAACATVHIVDLELLAIRSTTELTVAGVLTDAVTRADADTLGVVAVATATNATATRASVSALRNAGVGFSVTGLASRIAV
jgi:hypothetical protein